MTMLLSDILRRNAAMLAHAPAVRDSNRSLSWGELYDETLAVSVGLEELGAARGDRIAILVPNRVELVAAAFACFEAGLIFTPLNYFLTPTELRRLLDDAKPSVIVLDEEAFPALVAVVTEYAKTASAAVVTLGASEARNGYRGLVGHGRRPQGRTRCAEDAPAALIYTSGSTGRAKAALLSHRNWVHSCRDELYSVGWTRDDVMLQQLPMFHTSFVHFLTACLAGASSVLMQGGGPEKLVEAVETAGVTASHMVVANLSDLVRLLEETQTKLTSLKTLIYGGSPIPYVLIERAVKVLGNVLTQFYGQTEAGGALTVLRPEEHLATNGAGIGPWCSVGRAMPSVTLRIDGAESFDDENEGEVLVQTDGNMLGYWGEPPTTGGDNWLRTGDVGRLDRDGYLYIVDRIKDMIICGGENVPAREVEEVLIEHPAVRDAAVVGVPDSRLGEHVAAVIVLEPGAEGAAALEAYVKSNLAGMRRPRTTLVLDELPRTAVGKVDKPALRRLVAERAETEGSPSPGGPQ